MTIRCRLGLHTYKVIETRRDHGCVRALVRCERCGKLFHALHVGERFGMMPAEKMAAFWGLPGRCGLRINMATGEVVIPEWEALGRAFPRGTP